VREDKEMGERAIYKYMRGGGGWGCFLFSPLFCFRGRREEEDKKDFRPPPLTYIYIALSTFLFSPTFSNSMFHPLPLPKNI
jgi:hypothetical protein